MFGIEKALSKCLLLSLVIILQNSTPTLGNELQNLFVIILLKWSVMCLFVVFFAHCIIVILINNHLKIINVGKEVHGWVWDYGNGICYRRSSKGIENKTGCKIAHSGNLKNCLRFEVPEMIFF